MSTKTGDEAGTSNQANQKSVEGDEELYSLDFDDILQHVGEFGVYQKLLFLLIMPFYFYYAWVYFTQFFITITPDKYWCLIPELENLTQDERVSLAIPKLDGAPQKCLMYDVNYTELLLQTKMEPDPSWPTIMCLHGWEYNFTDVPYKTISTELNWVCDYNFLPTVAQAIFFCGAILGGLIFGFIADKYGRIPALVGTNMIALVAGICTSFCNAFWNFCLCRFLVGIGFDNCYMIMYILILEYMGPKWRTLVANMSIAVFFTAAMVSLPWIALAIGDWRNLCLATSVPLSLSFLTPWCVDESARWLVSQGKVDKAVAILKKIEKVNGKKVGHDVYQKFIDSCKESQMKKDKTYSVLDFFKTPRLRKITILLILIWSSISILFDGHARIVGSLGFNAFHIFSIGSFTELPADTILVLTLDRWGRRSLAFGTLVASGVFSLLAAAVPLGIPFLTLAIISRLAINISFNIGLQYAAELLPTVTRAQGVALVHIIGYVATILSPFIIYSANISTILPLIILGIIAMIGGCLSLFLPETMNQVLPQTLEDGENFGRNQKFFEFPCIKK